MKKIVAAVVVAFSRSRGGCRAQSSRGGCAELTATRRTHCWKRTSSGRWGKRTTRCSRHHARACRASRGAIAPARAPQKTSRVELAVRAKDSRAAANELVTCVSTACRPYPDGVRRSPTRTDATFDDVPAGNARTFKATTRRDSSRGATLASGSRCPTGSVDGEVVDETNTSSRTLRIWSSSARCRGGRRDHRTGGRFWLQSVGSAVGAKAAGFALSSTRRARAGRRRARASARARACESGAGRRRGDAVPHALVLIGDERVTRTMADGMSMPETERHRDGRRNGSSRSTAFRWATCALALPASVRRLARSGVRHHARVEIARRGGDRVRTIDAQRRIPVPIEIRCGTRAEGRARGPVARSLRLHGLGTGGTSSSRRDASRASRSGARARRRARE